MSTLALGSGCKYGGRFASRLLTSRSPVLARGPRVGDPCSDPCHAEAGGVRVKGGSVFLCPQTHRPLSPSTHSCQPAAPGRSSANLGCLCSVPLGAVRRQDKGRHLPERSLNGDMHSFPHSPDFLLEG